MMTWTTHRRAVKMHARKSLAGNFFKGVIAALITFSVGLLALSFMPLQVPDTINAEEPIALLKSMVPAGDLKTTAGLIAIALLLYLLLTAPLNLGKHMFYLSAVREEKPKLRMIFDPFFSLSQVFSSCALVVISAVWQGLLAIALFIVPLGLIFLSPTLGPLASIGGFALYLIAFFLLLVLSTPFILAPFALAAKPELGAFRSILVARKMLKGAKLEFLVFNFSFALWYIFFGLNAPGAFFIEPYISASMAGFFVTADACKNK